MKEQPQVSVVIATYNRLAQLARPLESMLDQETDEIAFEVMVVATNATDATRGLVNSFLERGYANLRYLFPIARIPFVSSPQTRLFAGTHSSALVGEIGGFVGSALRRRESLSLLPRDPDSARDQLCVQIEPSEGLEATEVALGRDAALSCDVCP